MLYYFGYILNIELFVVYSGVFVFIYMFLCESFGIFILEVMVCGIFVIILIIFVMFEIVGLEGILVNLFELEEIVFVFFYLEENVEFY